MVKLKQKLQFRGYVGSQAVRSELIQQVLNYYYSYPLHNDKLVDINNIDSSLTALQNDADDNDAH